MDQNLFSLVQQDVRDLIQKYKKAEAEHLDIRKSLDQQRTKQSERETSIIALQVRQSSTGVQQEGDDEQFGQLLQWKEQQIKENNEILDKLEVLEKTLNEELLMRVKGVEEDLDGVKERVKLQEENICRSQSVKDDAGG